MTKNDEVKKTVAETFDEYDHSYSSAVNDAVKFTGMSVDYFTETKANYLKDIARDHFVDRHDISVLDVGCGIGNYHPLLVPHFPRLAGVDVSDRCVETARSRNKTVDYRSYDGTTLPYDDGSFDLAFAICVVHHVPPVQWQNFAQEMYRVLKPGGLALIFEHNPLNPLTMRVVNNCPFDEDAVLLKSQETVSLMRGANFSNVKARFILSVPARNSGLRMVDRLFAHIPLGAQYYVSAVKSSAN